MRSGALPGPVRRVASRLATAAIALGASGAPCAAVWFPQADRPAQSPAAAPGGEDGAVGRRDPFLPVPQRAAEPRRAAGRARGLAGLRVADVKIVGIVTAVDVRLAVLEAPDGRTYVARVNDRLADGIVGEVARDSVVFLLQAEGREGADLGREMHRALGDRSDRPSPRRSPRRSPRPGRNRSCRPADPTTVPVHMGRRAARRRLTAEPAATVVVGFRGSLASAGGWRSFPSDRSDAVSGGSVAWRGACTSGGASRRFPHGSPRVIPQPMARGGTVWR